MPCGGRPNRYCQARGWPEWISGEATATELRNRERRSFVKRRGAHLDGVPNTASVAKRDQAGTRDRHQDILPPLGEEKANHPGMAGRGWR